MKLTVNIFIKIILIFFIFFNVVIFWGRLNSEYSLIYNILETMGSLLGLIGIYLYIYGRNIGSLILVGSSILSLAFIICFIDINMLSSKYFWIMIIVFIYFLIATVRKRQRKIP